MGNFDAAGSRSLEHLYQKLKSGGISPQEAQALSQKALENKNISPQEKAFFEHLVTTGEWPKGTALPSVQAFETHALDEVFHSIPQGFLKTLPSPEKTQALFDALPQAQQTELLDTLNQAPSGDLKAKVLSLLTHPDPKALLSSTDAEGTSLLKHIQEINQNSQFAYMAKHELYQVLQDPDRFKEAYQLSHDGPELLKAHPAEFLKVITPLQSNSTAGLSKAKAPADVKAALEPTLKIMEQIQPDGKKAADFIRNLSDSRIRLSDAPLQYLGGLAEAAHEAAWVVTQNKIAGPVGNPLSLRSRLVLNDTFWQRTDGEKASGLYHEYIHSQQMPGYGATGHHEDHAYRHQVVNAFEGAPLYIQRGDFHTLIQSNLEAEKLSTDSVKLIKDMDAADLWTSKADFATMRQEAQKLNAHQKSEMIEYLMEQNPTTGAQETLISHILADSSDAQLPHIFEDVSASKLASELENNAQATQVAVRLATHPQLTTQAAQFLTTLAQEHREAAINGFISDKAMQNNNPEAYKALDATTLKAMAMGLMEGHTSGAERKTVYSILANTSWDQFGKIMDAPFRDRLKSELSAKEFEQVQKWFWELPKHL